DHARSLSAEKRGRKVNNIDFPEIVDLTTQHADQLLILDEALTRLSAWSPRKAQVIEMRYFAGLRVEEMAELLGVSIATISREQKMAEAWLVQTMGKAPEIRE